MPTERIAMRKVREILRLTYDAKLPSREVGRQVGVGSTGVRVMLQRFRASKLEWPLPDGLTDTALEAELYGVAATRGGQRDRPEPDWAAVNRELKRKHVTLQVLWDEYIEVQPDGDRYSRFCELYRAWERRPADRFCLRARFKGAARVPCSRSEDGNGAILPKSITTVEMEYWQPGSPFTDRAVALYR